MKFGLSLHPYSLFSDLQGLLKTTQLADELGFEAVTFGEHVVWPRSHEGVVSPLWYDCLVLGTAIAAVTRRIKVQYSVLVLPYHQPVRLAKAIATLDVFSGGRVIVGVGMGWLETEFPPMGVSFKDRAPMTEEHIRAMKVLWTQENPTFQGRFVSFRDIQFEPRPVQKPNPPIWVGGYVRRSLERAVELGDGMHPGARAWEGLKKDMAELRDLLLRKGRNPQQFPLAYTMAYGREQDEIVRQYQRRGVQDRPVLSDRREEAVEQLEAYRRLGFTHIVVRFPSRDQNELWDAMRRFQADVLTPLGSF